MIFDLYKYPDNNRKVFEAYLVCPSLQKYLVAVETLQGSSCYSPYSSELCEVNRLIESNNLDCAHQFLLKNSCNLILSPIFHMTMAFFFNRQRQVKKMKYSYLIATNCIKGILSSGDGTKEKPYLITRVSDEHDVLNYLGKTLTLQSLVKVEDKAYDRLQCVDKTVLWFELRNMIN